MRRSLNTKTFTLVHDYQRGSSGTSQSDLNYKKVFSHETDIKAWVIIAFGSWACSASGAHSIRAHIAWSTIQLGLRLTTLGTYPAGILLPPSYHIHSGTLWHRTRGILPGILLSHHTLYPCRLRRLARGILRGILLLPASERHLSHYHDMALAYQRQYAFNSFTRLEKILALKKENTVKICLRKPDLEITSKVWDIFCVWMTWFDIHMSRLPKILKN